MSYIFNPDKEQFRPIPDYPDYEIGDHGTVRSLKFGKVRVLKARLGNHGYLQVGLCKNGKVKFPLIHRLVGQSFCENDNPDINTVINHKDSCKTNNKASNLEWCTPKHNTEEAWKNGLCEAVRQAGINNVGENHGNCKLIDIECDLIRIKYATGDYKQKDLAEEFGIGQTHVSRVVRGERRSKPTPQNIQ